MNLRPMQASGVGRITAVVALAIVVAGCGPDTPTQSPRLSPLPGPPSIRASTFTYQFDGSRLTLQVVVDPNDSPTDVVLEYGSGSTFDQTLVMAEGLLDPGQLSATTDALPADWVICGRVTATNAFDFVSLDFGCDPGLVWPTDTPNPNASPRPRETLRVCPTAALPGVLVADGSELAIREDHTGFIREVDWPSGYDVRSEGDELVLRDPVGGVVAHEGDHVQLQGGEESSDGPWVVCDEIIVDTE